MSLGNGVSDFVQFLKNGIAAFHLELPIGSSTGVQMIGGRKPDERQIVELTKDWKTKDESVLWLEIVTAIPYNVLNWFHEDLFSRKMGALLAGYIRDHQGQLGATLLAMMMIRQKLKGWDKEVERFIIGENKNSFHLSLVFQELDSEFRVSFSTERTRQEMRRLSAMALAKDSTGSKHPNKQTCRKNCSAYG